MSEPSLAVAEQLLAGCSVFLTFDQPALKEVLHVEELEAEALIAAAAVESIAPGRYRLHPDAQPPLLRLLRERSPRDEQRLHRAAFHHFASRLAAGGPGGEEAHVIGACMHHLRALHNLSLHYLNWSEIEELMGLLRGAALAPMERCQLMVIEAYHALRRQSYDHSDELLRAVLETPALPGSLRAEALLTRGLCALNQVRLEAASADFAAAQEEAARVGDQIIVGRALINQGWIHNELDRYEAALVCGRRALEHFEAANDLYATALALYSVGNNAVHLGQWELGREHLDRAAAIYETAGITGRLVTVDWGRGFLHQMLGDVVESKRAYRRALRLAGSVEDSILVTVSDALSDLGLIYQIQGRHETARRTLKRAAFLAGRLNAHLRQALLMHRHSQLLAEQGARGAALRRLAAAIDRLEQLRVSTRAEEMKIGLLGTSQQVYESMVLSQLAQGDIAAAFAYVERARARAFLDLLALRDGPIELRPQEPVGLEQLQRRLAPGVLVLEFFTVGVVPPGGSFISKIPAANRRLRERLVTPPQIILFAITADRAEVHRIAFDPNALQPSPGDPRPGWHLLTERKLRWLYSTLLTPVEGLLLECRALHLIPHGPLHFIPFAALQAPEGATLLRPGGPSLTYAPSATVLAHTLDQEPSSATATLALGYDDRGATALLLAEREAQMVGRRAGGYVRVGNGPKTELITAQAAQLRWLHIAGHAIYRADDPMGSFLRLGAGDELDARTIMSALALPGTLVTLNACTSGLSHVASGDELLGLPRAFQYAGAATIVCALHEVDDLAAYILMVFFAENLALGASPSEALHTAQLRLRRCHREEAAALIADSFTAGERGRLPDLDGYGEPPFAHPRYWASFMVVGRP